MPAHYLSPPLDTPMLSRFALGVALALCTALYAPASVAAQQAGSATIDSLVAQLRSPDFHVRWGAIIALGRYPRGQLPSRAVTEIVALLDREADPTPVPPTAPPTAPPPAAPPASRDTANAGGTDVDHSYGEYVLAVIDVALSLEDPRTVRGIALMGVETSRKAEMWVASHGSAALPALDEAWRVKRSGQSGILGTWALMIGPYADRLRAGDAVAVRRRMIGAVGEHALSFALSARDAPLPEVIPLLEALATHEGDFVRSRVRRAVEVLRPIRDTTAVDALLHGLGMWIGVVCLDQASPARRAACTSSLGDPHERAAQSLASGRRDQAAEALVDLVSRADATLAAGGMSRNEHRLVAGNAMYVAGRLRSTPR